MMKRTMKTTTKHAFTLLLAILAWATGLASAEVGVPIARDLQKDAGLAKDKNGVVLVMFSGPQCGYCQTVLNEFLIPMSRNAEYQAKLVMRKVELSSPREMKDFQGDKTPHRSFAGASGVRLIPTIMVFDTDGKLLSKPVVGLSTIDYYGEHLDQAIDNGLAKVRAKK
jgi:thioredoxin-related protein